jgi:anti-sigma regulatory factor (Ser/Thr protein kinase)
VDFARANGADDRLSEAIGLAVTEAATNAVVHAYVDREQGTVTVATQVAADGLELRVVDDGRGMRPAWTVPE